MSFRNDTALSSRPRTHGLIRLLAEGICWSLTVVIHRRVERRGGHRRHGPGPIWVSIRRWIRWMTAIRNRLVRFSMRYRVAPIGKDAVELGWWGLSGIHTLRWRVLSTIRIQWLRAVLGLRRRLNRVTCGSLRWIEAIGIVWGIAILLLPYRDWPLAWPSRCYVRIHCRLRRHRL